MEDLIASLQDHARKHDLKNKAVECCRIYLRNYLADEPEEFARVFDGVALEDLQLIWRKHYLVFADDIYQYPHILTQVRIGERSEYLSDGVWPRAIYELETLLDGTINDDWFRAV